MRNYILAFVLLLAGWGLAQDPAVPANYIANELDFTVVNCSRYVTSDTPIACMSALGDRETATLILNLRVQTGLALRWISPWTEEEEYVGRGFEYNGDEYYITVFWLNDYTVFFVIHPM